MEIEDFSPLFATSGRGQNPQPPEAGGPSRRNARRDLGDVGSNRAQQQPAGRGRRQRGQRQQAGRRGGDAVSSGEAGQEWDYGTGADVFGEVGFGAFSSDGNLDESQVKFLFGQFMKTFGSAGGGQVLRSDRNDDDDFDMDLDNLALGRRAGRGGQAATARADPKYLAALRRIVEGRDSDDIGDTTGGLAVAGGTPNNAFPVDLKDIQTFNVNLLQAILHEPANAIVFMDETIEAIVVEEFPDLGQNSIVLRVCVYNHPRACCMRDLNPGDIESLIAIRGVVIRASHVIPDMQVAVFRCTARVTANQTTHMCGHEEEVRLSNGEVQEPLRCVACENKFAFELCHTKCTFGNKQLLKIQETPDSIPEGETPHTVMAYAYDDMVDLAKPGDRVEVTGIYKASGVRVLAKQRNLKAVYRTHVDVNHLGKERVTQFKLRESELEGQGSKQLTQAEFAAAEGLQRPDDGPSSLNCALYPPHVVQQLRQIAADPNVYQNLVKSLAPNIWEQEDVKKGLLCQLFSGRSKNLADRTTRAEIHILLCGDPSTAKSQLLQYVNNTAPRGVYCCGRGTSAVGLTASVTRDAETREYVLESGAIVLSDRGICCIDEFDKMDDGARVILHEVMEQQTVSIAKAGIVCSVNARTSILASANPVNSRYDTRRSVVDNINLPPTLLSRFDLIYLMLDNYNVEIDRQLATHLCALYAPEEVRTSHEPPISSELLAQYISYARSVCFPRLSDASGQELASTYLQFRRQGADSSGKSLSATPRQLESLIRLSEALARMQLNDVVTVEHVKEAARLIQVATYNAIVDPLTGRIDFEQLNRGTSGAARERREVLEKAVCTVLMGDSGGIDKETLLKRLEEQFFVAAGAQGHALGFTKESFAHELESCVRGLELMGTVAKTHAGRYMCHM